MSSMPDDEQRRDFMRRSLTLIPAVSLGSGVTLTASAAEEPPALADYQPSFFNTDEWQFILAACDQLIPSDEHGPGALETNVPIFIDKELYGPFGHADRWYMQGPFITDGDPELGYQLPYTPRELYRHGIAAVERYCQQEHDKAFSALDAATRDDILGRLEQDKIDFAALDAAPLTAGVFFSFLWQNIREGYFADPIYGGNKHMGAWKMIGFTGARANFREWVEQHNVPYPLGPVSLSGERG
ncbi:gluconate 2-dehydrogenase subunit 3 family protein [Phytohalomonas tamaricis]|uniref:gluconate 2-dehydrogenase subunit 3 family protein n=1 Tax=Phytohalomonas tamaricis TaxID=2081032 RepID=UPI0021D481F8|nr:gluconate 2-dehydrogenase subunit 3 family protein [Phytohalomonas tamaricis]